ncbi:MULTISPECIES: hypothetical protein [unclassified Roseateles]|uniref:hypothetical protein n=1 Tax=unclassified Roseateles TaxID=2626991 RepID=UPI000715AADB|nr:MULTISPECIES: hypothetical protein [unclassified Roseateles]KQW46236.1 hypothetical protein ASC81_07415 [Pelomonas sp. Root405]KRA73285.1 hypothetical protein ASD88_07415 [Pelomonas sp. Root662]
MPAALEGPTGRMPPRSNLISQDGPRDFWVWADMHEPLVREGLQRSGEFVSAARVEEKVAALPFVENPGFLGQLSPFGLNVVRDYAVEYRLELHRLRQFLSHPSRMSAIFLFGFEGDAWRYASTPAAGPGGLGTTPGGSRCCARHPPASSGWTTWFAPIGAAKKPPATCRFVRLPSASSKSSSSAASSSVTTMVLSRTTDDMGSSVHTACGNLHGRL